MQLGTGKVIKGWDQGLVGLCVGAKAKLIIPPELGYGDSGAGGAIPGGATLNFDVEVVSIGEAPKQPNIFKEIDGDGDKKLTKEEIAAWFMEKQGKEMPDALWSSENKDGDDHISWEEFSGPKGDAADEL
jgi:FK506-binding protein 14